MNCFDLKGDTLDRDNLWYLLFMVSMFTLIRMNKVLLLLYRKPTHTDQYLNFHSNHHLQHKRAVVNTLLLQAHTLLSEEVDKIKEIQHVKEALKANNYPDWMLTIPNTGSALRDSKESVNEKRIYASVPYLKGTLERLQRAFKSHGYTCPQAFQFLKITTRSCEGQNRKS